MLVGIQRWSRRRFGRRSELDAAAAHRAELERAAAVAKVHRPTLLTGPFNSIGPGAGGS
ncbi:hypothetical protein ACFV1L_15125 [Kitasatospora sp. NPDC059646]|uniref:hypothetical protein n=1 Tax=Kitasatospora sp. NPDC059646 TaxID=3346893 RepID=UPI0036871287